MWISARQASAMLHDRPPNGGLSRGQAQLVLDSGLAGTALRTTAAHLYRAQRVEDLCAWPTTDATAAAAIGPCGVIIGRRRISVSDEVEQQVAPGWNISPWKQAWLTLMIARHGPFPFIATVAGFVVAGFGIAGLDADPARRADGARSVRLRLAPPGIWFRRVRGHRLLVGRGGPWVHLEPTRLEHRRWTRERQAKYQ